MLTASEYRAKARGALKGRWGLGVGAWFVATLLGGTYITAASSGNVVSNVSSEQAMYMLGYQPVLAILVVALIYYVVLFVISGAMRIGYAKFNLNLTQQQPVKFSDIFWGFSMFGKSFALTVLTMLFYTFVIVVSIILMYIAFFVVAMISSGSNGIAMFMLFVILILFVVVLTVVMVKIYFAPYILAENPTLKASEALKLSNKLMEGNVWKFVCLNLSFIGWNILAALTLYIGYLWVGPYFEAATTFFYQDLVYNDKMKEQVQSQPTGIGQPIEMARPEIAGETETTTSFAEAELEREVKAEADEI